MLEPREMSANIERMKNALGLEKLSAEKVRDYLRKMSHSMEIARLCLADLVLSDMI